MSAAAATPPADPDPDSSPATGAPRLWTRSFINLIIAQSVFGFAYAQFVLLPKLLAVGYHATARQIGVVMAAFGVASLVAIPVMAPVMKRLGCRRAMVLGNLLLAGSALGFLFIHSAGWAAALLRGVHGIAWSFFFAAGMTLVADVAPKAKLAQAIGLFGAAALSMSALGPAVAEPMAARWGAHSVFVLAAVVAAVGAWFCLRLPEAAIATTPSRATVAEPSSARTRTSAIIVFAVGGLASTAVVTFVAPFALQHHIEIVRGFFVAYTVTALAMRIGGARVTDRMGHRRVALAGCAGYGLVMVVMGGAGPGHLILLGAAFGIAHGILYPALMALVIGDLPADRRPRALAFTNGAINLGVAGVGVLGTIAEHTGYPGVFIATGAATVAAALLLVRSSPPRAAASLT